MTAVLTRTKHGVYLVPPFDVYLSSALIRMGEYAPAEFATWRPYLPDEGVILDVGANIGAHTLPFVHAVGRNGLVIAIEPQRMLCAMLHGTLALNGIWNVRVENAAVGSSNGAVHVPYLDYGADCNFGSLSLDGSHDDKPGEMVPRIALDAMVPRSCDVDFVKLDVEGAELGALNGATALVDRCRPVLSVEADREPQVPGLLAYFAERDYRVWWHKPPLGSLWPNIVSINLLAIPREREDLPEPEGFVEEVKT